MPTVSRSAATCCGGCKTEDKGAGKIFNAADYFCFMLDDTLGALAMRRFCGSFLVHGGSGNRPTCSSDKIKIQHRGTPSTPFFVLCRVQLCSTPAITANNFLRRIIVSSWTSPKSLPGERLNLRLKGRDNSYFRAS